jgi:hypothetical protein
MNIIKYLKELLKDKTHNYSLREFVIAMCMVLIVISWFSQLLFNVTVPEYMFYSIVSLVAAGCFGYSIEKHQSTNEKENDNI